MNEISALNQTETASDTSLSSMADILLLPTPEPVLPTGLILAGMIVIGLLVLLLWRQWRQPLATLERRLRQEQLSCREAAHQLARICRQHSQFKQRIDQLRFQRPAPERSELLLIINLVKHER